MKTSLSWLRDYVELPSSLTTEQLDDALTNLGLEVESLVDQAATVKGDLVVGRVLTDRGADRLQEADPVLHGRRGPADPAGDRLRRARTSPWATWWW